MACRLSKRGEGFLKIALIVEGFSDNILLSEQRRWFSSLGMEIDIITAGDKRSMIRKAIKFYNASIASGASHVIFLPDQNGDQCALVTRKKVNADDLPRATTLVIKRELEAWILADRRCLNCKLDPNYHTSGTTDNVPNPKQILFSLIHKKLGYTPTAVEAAKIFADQFSIVRAAVANNSAKRLVNIVNSLV